jgi:DNA replication protein DnaC
VVSRDDRRDAPDVIAATMATRERPSPRRCQCGAEVAYVWHTHRARSAWVLAGPIDPCSACREPDDVAERRRQSAVLLEAGFPARAIACTERVVRRQPGETPEQYRARALAEGGVATDPAHAELWRVGVREWRQHRGSVALWGPCGTGKTVIATVIARVSTRDEPPVELRVEGRLAIAPRFGTSVGYVTARGIADAQAKAFKADYEPLNRLRRVGLLVIDEMARDEEPSRLEVDAVEEVISVRYESSRPVVVVTNAEWTQITGEKAIYGDRVADRLRGMCGDRVFKLAGDSWR